MKYFGSRISLGGTAVFLLCTGITVGTYFCSLRPCYFFKATSFPFITSHFSYLKFQDFLHVRSFLKGAKSKFCVVAPTMSKTSNRGRGLPLLFFPQLDSRFHREVNTAKYRLVECILKHATEL